MASVTVGGDHRVSEFPSEEVKIVLVLRGEENPIEVSLPGEPPRGIQYLPFGRTEGMPGGPVHVRATELDAQGPSSEFLHPDPDAVLNIRQGLDVPVERFL